MTARVEAAGAAVRVDPDQATVAAWVVAVANAVRDDERAADAWASLVDQQYADAGDGDSNEVADITQAMDIPAHILAPVQAEQVAHQLIVAAATAATRDPATWGIRATHTSAGRTA